MKNLTKFVRRLSRRGAIPQVVPASETRMTDDPGAAAEKLNLKDRELIGFIEAMDKRLFSLEHDLWVIRSRIAELTDKESTAP